MPTVIDSISIEIESSSSKAADGIKALANSLGELKKNGSVGVAVKNLKELSAALKGMTSAASNASKISSLAKAMGELKSVGSTGTGVKKMAESLASLKDVTKALDDKTIAEFASRVELVSQKLTGLSSKMTTIQAGFSAINTKARKAGGGVKHFGNRLDASSINLSSFIHIMQSAVRWVQRAIDKFQELIKDASEWEGISARFGRGFGPQAQETYEWIQKLNQEMGINTQQFMQYSSTYATMLKGFGVAQEDASKMALGYMELTYDIWAGYNDQYKTLEDAAEAVRSAIAGEVEPVRKIGSTIIESVLEQTAANHGLKISLENATEAQKSYLRYLTMVDQAHAQNLVGTYAAEMNTAEGVMRTFAQQTKSLAQAFGSLLLPVLVEVMPYLQAVVELMKEAVYDLAAFFNVDIQEVDWSGYNAGVNETVEGMDALAKSAKEAKKQLMGIDELTVLSQPSSSSSSGGSDFEMPDINSVWDQSIFENIQLQVDSIKDKVETALAEIALVASKFSLAIGTLLVLTGANIPLGLAMMAAGLAIQFSAAKEDWGTANNKINDSLLSTAGFSAGFLLTVGALMAFSGAATPLGIAMMVAGAASLYAARDLNWNTAEEKVSSSLSLVEGAMSGFLLGLGAVLAFSGVGTAVGIALMASGAAVMASSKALKWDEVKNNVDNTAARITSIVSGSMLALGAVLAFTGVATPLGIALMAGGAIGLATSAGLNWSVVSEKTKTVIDGIAKVAGGSLLAIGAILALSGVALPLGLGMMAAGGVSLVASLTPNWNSIVDKVRETFRKVKSEVSSAMSDIKKSFDSAKGFSIYTSGISGLNTSGVKKYATGGFPSTGEMFIARENGIPEMVGRMGSRTAVANNYQIVEGVAAGVESANEDMITAFYAMGQQIVRAINEKEMNAYIDTRRISTAQSMRSRAYGV